MYDFIMFSIWLGHGYKHVTDWLMFHCSRLKKSVNEAGQGQKKQLHHQKQGAFVLPGLK